MKHQACSRIREEKLDKSLHRRALLLILLFENVAVVPIKRISHAQNKADYTCHIFINVERNKNIIGCIRNDGI